MIWNTLWIWFIAFVVLLGITFVGGILGGGLGAFLFALFCGQFIVPITSAIAGFRAANGKGNIIIALVISVIVGFILLYFSTDGFSLYGKTLWINLIPVLITLAGFGLGKLMLATKSINLALYGGSVVLAIFVCTALLYFFGAFQSQMAYSVLPTELFYMQPENNITAFHGENDDSKNHLLYSDDTNEAFTGKIISYRERLTLDFFTENPSGISYYADGFLFGESGDVVKSGYHNSWHGTDEYIDQWLYNEPAALGQSYLLHKDYQKTIQDEFPAGVAVYYVEEPDLRQNYNTSPLPKAVVIYSDGNKLIRKEVTYHQNGVIDWIETHTNSGEGWNKDYSINFDQLGYAYYADMDFDKKVPWHEEDFVLSDFNAYEYVPQAFDGLSTISDKPKKMVYAPYAENWQEGGNLVDNIISVYGFPLTSISINIGGTNQAFIPLETIEEMDNFCALMGISTLTLHFNETDDEIDHFQYGAVRFRIDSGKKEKSITFYYKEGKMLIEDGPYYLDLLAEPQHDNQEDTARRKNLYKIFMDIIAKYISEEPLEVEFPIE